jgi:hypothetical protein
MVIIGTGAGLHGFVLFFARLDHDSADHFTDRGTLLRANVSERLRRPRLWGQVDRVGANHVGVSGLQERRQGRLSHRRDRPPAWQPNTVIDADSDLVRSLAVLTVNRADLVADRMRILNR